jgi:hypothetical protein
LTDSILTLLLFDVAIIEIRKKKQAFVFTDKPAQNSGY